jgi:hypothetical protein
MPQRSAIELVTEVTPLRHESVHEAYKICSVSRFQQVDQLMDEDIFQALTGFLASFVIIFSS